MSEHQMLSLLVVLQGVLTVMGFFIALQIYREVRDSADRSREISLMVSASLGVAREILQQVKK